MLDPLCLLGVGINPEGRVRVDPGPAAPELVRNGWRAFLIKVRNEAGVTAELRATSPNAAPPYRPSTGAARPAPGLAPGEVADRWLDLDLPADRPLRRALSGLALEYRVILISGRDAGRREARLRFDLGRDAPDLGSRGELDILFRAAPAVAVALDVRDADGRPTTASFLIRDAQGRVYPAPTRRLAPDFWFQPQVYRRSGESVDLAPGRYTVAATRGPEYEVETRTIEVPDAAEHRESFRLRRWIEPAQLGWFSGDHHVHAAGCSHYERPTEGVGPEDIIRQLAGEGLDVAACCVLSWGPCWYAQKAFFAGADHPLSTRETLMRYDVEVSGFPSSPSGHLCLLRLKEDDFPGASSIEDWPSWDLPILRWARAQGAVVGFAHSGWGLELKDDAVPSLDVPPFDGIGAMEYLVDVAHDAVDFLSTVDTPAPRELTIWYHALNCGFRTRISGETDFPCITDDRVGLGRSYVRLPAGVRDYDRWVEGVRDGRSYVADGKSHLIDFRVDDVRVGEAGSERRLDAPGTVLVSARVAARLDPSITPEGRAIRARPLGEKPYWDLERARVGESRTVPIEVVVNGRAVARMPVAADGTLHEVRFPVEIERSSWVALRIYPSSHTNPVFVTVAGRPIRASRASADWCLRAVDRCWAQKSPTIRPAERPAAQAAYDAARATYRKILAESAVD